MSQILLTNLRIINPFGDVEFIENGSIEISDGSIVSVGAELTDSAPDIQKIDMGGKTVLPGMINAHTHLYSSLALGMPPSQNNPVNFTEILKQVWWKLDRALDEDSTRASFQVGLLNALKNGVTTLVDHHSSQNFIDGSTRQLVELADAFGIRIATAFETSDRNGDDTFASGLDENLTAIHEFANREHIHPMLGLHASFTLSDKSLKAIGKELENLTGTGIHIHVAEDLADERDAKMKGYHSVIQRLDKFNLLNEHSLIIHGIHMEQTDIDLILKRGAQLVHCPTSNANNRVGNLSPLVVRKLNAGLGTDGMQSNMLKEAKEGTLIRSASLPGGVESVNYLQLLFQNNRTIAEKMFNQKLGKIESGYPADLVFYDYCPVTELNDTNWQGHALFGFESPTDVMTRGLFRIKNGKLAGIDENGIFNNAQSESRRLWQSMKNVT
ncbi:MAG: amidohydrolase family protein [Candidatus Marinimicrobia bacterium]|nr:amidohydrolase family protein [Candidatus Neomarinimicrobiota bacterium]